MVIQLHNTHFSWPKSKSPCLIVPDFNVAKGEHIFFYGPSGCGKSTLLALIAGVLLPEQGRIELLGYSLTDLSSAKRDQLRVDSIGFIFQQFNLIPYLSVLDNVLLPCRFSQKRYHAAIAKSNTVETEAKNLLSKLEISENLLHKNVMHLSVGQQQRVAVARALIGAPDIIIADEPTSALDAQSQHAFMTLLSQQCADLGSTLLFVSHDQRLSTSFTRTVNLVDLNTATRGIDA